MGRCLASVGRMLPHSRGACAPGSLGSLLASHIQDIVREGHAADAAHATHIGQRDELWEPLRHALRAVARGTSTDLSDVPEAARETEDTDPWLVKPVGLILWFGEQHAMAHYAWYSLRFIAVDIANP